MGNRTQAVSPILKHHTKTFLICDKTKKSNILKIVLVSTDDQGNKKYLFKNFSLF